MKSNISSVTAPAIAEASQVLVKRTVLEWLGGEDVVVVLFGSRATGTSHRYSDFDIGILPGQEFDRGRLSSLREVLGNLNIPYAVEVVDLSAVSPKFRKLALKDAMIWKS